NADLFGHPARIVDVVERAAAAGGAFHRQFRQAPLIPELHGQPHHAFAAACEQTSHRGAVHAAAHGHGNRRAAHAITGDNRRRWVTDDSTASTRASTCAAVFERPSEKRMLARARSAGSPMAVSTCEGWTAPLEQAAPVETANPRRSSAITSASPSR